MTDKDVTEMSASELALEYNRVSKRLDDAPMGYLTVGIVGVFSFLVSVGLWSELPSPDMSVQTYVISTAISTALALVMPFAGYLLFKRAQDDKKTCDQVLDILKKF